MFSRRIQSILKMQDRIKLNSTVNIFHKDKLKNHCSLFSTGSISTDLPKKRKKSERKPWVTDIKELKRLGRRERKERQMVKEKTLRPPENGLLVEELIPVADAVYGARTELFACVSMVAKHIAIHTCSLCGEVHVGHPPHKIRTCNVAGSLPSKEHSWKPGSVEHILPCVESFHLYDRIGRAVSHNECLEVDQIPAIIELCIQAGIDIPQYPTRRRVFPAYNLAGKIIDFEKRFPKDDRYSEGIDTFGFWGNRKKSSRENKSISMNAYDARGIAVRGMEAWERMRSGISKLMQKYAVQTCGYCPEVQVGPKGHRVRNCQAFKHQMRDGQHAWQEATVDDIVPPVYIWHVQDPKSGAPLVHRLKRYYGMLPAVVELFAQAGAKVSGDYARILRNDVAVPGLDEEKWVV